MLESWSRAGLPVELDDALSRDAFSGDTLGF